MDLDEIFDIIKESLLG